MSKNTLTYRHTILACFVGYIVQAIVNNFAPLLFLTFRESYGISLSKITLLVSFNFIVQLTIDLLSAFFVDRIGYRASALLAHGCCAAGFIALAVLPELLPDPFIGLSIAVLIYAVGGGLLEVLVSPIVEACPSDNKQTAMSLLHSFYCWGQVGVILLSTLFFTVFGIAEWRILAVIWAIVPILNFILFMQVPIGSLLPDGEKGTGLRGLLKSGKFWIMMLLMMCAGASEMAVSQWASAFAEMGLGVEKAIGDLAGPMMFALLMGIARAFYGKYGAKIRLERFMTVCGVLCMGGYLLAALSPLPVLSLIGCGLCGISVGIMWPGTFSLAAAGIRGGGTLLFALLALAGDLGCTLGPSVVGNIAEQNGGDLGSGLLFGMLFPLLLTVGLAVNGAMKKRKN